ncbi:hypothetical protein [Archangium violaceum]|uniref:hypothetical protein n=1 Tax=Archangium violaceum TaxID=83451 RepID=UPI0036D7B757
MIDGLEWDGGEAKAHHRPGMSMSTRARAMAALAGSAMMLWPPPPEPSESKHAPTVAVVALLEPVTRVGPEYEAPVLIGCPVLETPIQGQRKPPCKAPAVEFRGHCWVRLAHEWPCPRGTAVHEGRCYTPVSERTPGPGALSPRERPRNAPRGPRG